MKKTLRKLSFTSNKKVGKIKFNIVIWIFMAILNHNDFEVFGVKCFITLFSTDYSQRQHIFSVAKRL